MTVTTFFILYKYLIYRYIYKKRRKAYPSKNNCRNCLLSEKQPYNSSKRQKDNKIGGNQTIRIMTTNLEKRTKSIIRGSPKWQKMDSKRPF